MSEHGSLDGLLFCGEHECPMIRIGENYECVFDYTDRLIGGQRVVEITGGSNQTTLTLVFENGRKLPLLCPCCAGPVLIESGNEQGLQDSLGWFLHSLAYYPAEDGEPEALELVFAYFEDETPVLGEGLFVHMDSIRQL